MVCNEKKVKGGNAARAAMNVFGNADVMQHVNAHMRLLDHKRLMDVCSVMRHDVDAQRALFDRLDRGRRPSLRSPFSKVAFAPWDVRAVTRFYLNLEISHNAYLRAERGVVNVPILFLRAVSTTDGCIQANATDLVYARPDLF